MGEEMPNEDQSSSILHRILDRELLPDFTIWREYFGAPSPVEVVIDRALEALSSAIPDDTHCVLHGWIDQAVLEIVAIDRVAEIRDRTKRYRPDQGGDSGLLAVVGRRILVLEFSYERGEALLTEYKPIQPPEPTSTASALAAQLNR
ncbi:hypothetical protein [Actomonas aquatica]|uniref:Uncharacterized protein n=1 Tax=Actomonas aquatica TaxID=2866162 RepID=A0ABZ1CBV7_9BACT|nr:hypothetical protein [Opitutus sp. WL0086]WRQ89046.1 hypothetical protein K1X11_006475 [Opitutus sp. WL0086]